MLCRNPFMLDGPAGGVPAPCGQCLPCRVNRRREWTARLILENLCHEKSVFVTLTYDESSLPSDGQLKKDHYKNFMKRLRKAIQPVPLRFYLVGEYGTSTLRPHYHAIIFGLGPEDSSLIEKAWSMGFVQCGDATPQSAQYVAGYVVEKLNTDQIPELEDKEQPFARMSNRPGIGAKAIEKLSEALLSEKGLHALAFEGDVPQGFKMDGKTYPFGRYMRQKLREAVGMSEKDIDDLKKQWILDKSFEVFGVWQEACKIKDRDCTLDQKDAIVQHSAQAALNQETRLKIRQSRRYL